MIGFFFQLINQVIRWITSHGQVSRSYIEIMENITQVCDVGKNFPKQDSYSPENIPRGNKRDHMK